MDEADSAVVEELAVGIVRIDDDEALRIEFEMALDQRQRSLADRSEADHRDRACRCARASANGSSKSPSEDERRLEGA